MPRSHQGVERAARTLRLSALGGCGSPGGSSAMGFPRDQGLCCSFSSCCAGPRMQAVPSRVPRLVQVLLRAGWHSLVVAVLALEVWKHFSLFVFKAKQVSCI